MHDPTSANTGHDPFDLQRFVRAQQDTYADALAEIRAGLKRSHWMWFVFPQYRGLGMSPTSQRYAIRSGDEAQAYLDHPVLGPRLIESFAAVLDSARSVHQIFGSPDDRKLKSCATLFAAVAPDAPVFQQVLADKFAGERDQRTLELLRADSQ